MKTKVIEKRVGNTVTVIAIPYEDKPIYKKMPILTAFLVNLVIGLLIFVPYITIGHGIFSIGYDFNAQEIPFNIFTNSSIKSGNTNWSWGTDIGSDFITSYSYYNLGSPFFWLSLLFPAQSFPWIVGWIYILKYGVCGLTSFLYFKNRTEKYYSALIGSILYTFSGFNACNVVFYYYHDVVAFFPLIMIGLDELTQHSKHGKFLAAIAINAFVNYNFFVGEVIFIIIYYFVRYRFCEHKKNFWKNGLLCLWETILGVGLACILLYPSVMSLIQNPRISSHVDWSRLGFDSGDYILILRAFFFPAECMSKISVGKESINWYSTALYLPVIGPSLAIAYTIHSIKNRVLKKSKIGWLATMLLVCTVISLLYIPNSVFVLFTEEPYRRWYYMFLLLLVLASTKVIDHPDRYPWKKTLVFCITVSIVFIAVCCINNELILNRRLFLEISVIGVSGYSLFYFIFRKTKSENSSIKQFILLISTFAIITTDLSISTYRSDSGYKNSQEYYNDVIKTASLLKNSTLPYRYRFWDTYNNRGLTAGLQTVNSFNSTIEPSITEFYQALFGGEGRHNISEAGPLGVDDLLSVRSWVDCIQWENYSLAPEIVDNGYQKIFIYQNPEVIPIGFVQHKYILKSDYEKLSYEQRGVAMLKYLIVPDEKENLVSGTMEKGHVDSETVYTNDDRVQASEEDREECTEDFSYDTNGFTSTLKAKSDGYAFFSVPYSKNWSCTVDGKITEIMDTNGLMAVPVSSGEHTIVFSYHNNDRDIGLGITAVSSIISIGYFIFCRHLIKKRREMLHD